MRKYLLIIPLLLGLCFFGVVDWGFAEEVPCSQTLLDCLAAAIASDGIERSARCFTDSSSALSICDSNHPICSNYSSDSSCCDQSQTLYYYNTSSLYTLYYYVYPESCGLCPDLDPPPVEACLSESNVTWTDQDACEYECKCPDYEGQADYDFESCSVGGCQQQAKTACISEFNVTWTDQDACEYECKCPDYQGEPGYFFDTCSADRCRHEAEMNCDGSENIVWDDQESCQYSCVSCSVYEDNCSVRCADRGGSYSTCHEDEQGHAETFTCGCLDDDEGINCWNDPPPGQEDCERTCGAGNDIYRCTQAPDDDPVVTCSCKQDPANGLPPVAPEDEPKTCQEFIASCNPACTPWCVTGSDGFASHYNCDCSNNPDPDPDDPRDPDDPVDDPPSDDPSDPGDGNGWLASIKNNTDTLVDQGRDSNGWLEGIKHNTDTSLDLDQDRNETLSGISDKLDSLEGTVETDIGNVSDYDLPEFDLGEDPTEADLPTKEELNTSFGTLDPGDTSYLNAAESALNSLAPSFTSPDCTLVFEFYYDFGSLPHFGPFIIDVYQELSLCPYESYFNMIGNVLLALAGLWNIYALIFK